MSTSDSPPPGPDQEECRQSSGLFGFLFNRLGKRSISRASSGTSLPETSQQGDEQATKEKGGRCGWLHKAAWAQEGEEVTSTSNPQTSSRAPRETEKAEVLEPELSARQAAHADASASLSEALELQVGGRSVSDSADWDFRRRQVRRSSRPAQEWVRDSVAVEPVSDWTQSLQAYEHSQLPAHTERGASRQVARMKEENGARIRRRSKSAEHFRGSGSPLDQARWSVEEGRRSGNSKRTSFEAGLDQDGGPVSPRKSSERARRHLRKELPGHSDFLPAELVQRSRLFNSRGDK